MRDYTIRLSSMDWSLIRNVLRTAQSLDGITHPREHGPIERLEKAIRNAALQEEATLGRA